MEQDRYGMIYYAQTFATFPIVLQIYHLSLYPYHQLLHVFHPSPFFICYLQIN